MQEIRNLSETTREGSSLLGLSDATEIKEMKMKEKELAEKYKYYNNEIGK